MQRKLYPVKDARLMLGGIGQAKFYQLVNSGHIKFTKIGRRSFVHADDLEACANRLREESAA